jgi:2-succinyl-6-hydroxy-2,4-cyclohexadiene-1-carboxylate synthase
MAPTSAESTSPSDSRLRAVTVAARTQAGGDRIVLVHGFTQTAACWSPVDVALATDHELVLIDAPGHGDSAAVELNLVDGARAIVEVGGRGTYVGYSMGGRFALHAALERPDRVDRLVLISATPGIEDDDDRAERRRSDDRLADHLVSIGVPAFIDEWLRLPLFAGLLSDRNHRSARLANTAPGLASSLRRAGTGTQIPQWDRLGELEMPVLIVTGADDTTFTLLGERMAAGIGPNAELGVVRGAGHTVHLEQPDPFLRLLGDWLGRTTRP